LGGVWADKYDALKTDDDADILDDISSVEENIGKASEPLPISPELAAYRA
jgi:hypothetical protein